MCIYPKLLFKFTCLVPRGHPLIMARGTEQNHGGPAWPNPMPEAPLHAGPLRLFIASCILLQMTRPLWRILLLKKAKDDILDSTAQNERRESSPAPSPSLEDLVKVPGVLTNNENHVSGRSIQYQGLSQGAIKQMRQRKP